MPPKDILLKELDTVKNYVENKQFPLVMCHNDVWGRNIIYNPPGLLHTCIQFKDDHLSWTSLN